MGAILTGIGVSPGVASAAVAWLAPPPRPPVPEPAPDDVAAAATVVQAALAAVAAGYEERSRRLTAPASDLLAATAMMARDPLLLDTVRAELSGGAGVATAVGAATDTLCATFAAAGGILAERVTDLRDIRDRAIARLLGAPMPGIPDPGHPIVLVAHDLAPADTAQLDPGTVRAVVTVAGGATGHTAILARELGIPAVVGCSGAVRLHDGEPVVVDGTAGEVIRDPDDATARGATDRAAAIEAFTAPVTGAGRTADGYPVRLLANVGMLDEAERVGHADTEGVGLLRTEFLFLDRRRPPTEEEQAAAYSRILRAFGDRPVTARTLDVGADKPLPFVAMPPEPNPALGLRGLRLSRQHPQLLETQLRALARAAATAPGRLRVMAPMVATVPEAAGFAASARAVGLAEVGVMVELPAAALRARQLLAVVDFVSIGTNDLAQYTFAADRGSTDLAPLLDPWQPALLELLAGVCEAGAATGKPVGVCGEAAGDPLLACVLAGLGATSLSMAAGALPMVRAAIAHHDLATCRAMATAARSAGTAAAARQAASAHASASLRRLLRTTAGGPPVVDPGVDPGA